MIPFEITILGTGSALPTSQRYHTAHVLNVRERFFLIDCGEGTQNQMRKYGVKFSRIEHIFISHLHGDHYFGLIGLITSYLLLGRKTDLHIYSHSMLPDLLKPQIDMMGDELSYKIIWHPLNFKRSEIILDNKVVKVMSIPVQHRFPCCAFLFTEAPSDLNVRKEQLEKYQVPLTQIYNIKKGADYIDQNQQVIPNSELTLPAMKQRSYAFCTDTAFMPELSELFENVDLLYHEATFDKTNQKRAAETYHSTAHQAAQMAKMSNAGHLLIGHFSSRYKNIDKLLNEAREVFENCTAANEGMVIQIPQKRLV
ncbi:MAG: ribonuclease Z [Prolixibacteraceae bacterium]|jgi:ribonuclease Z|nr:ribonuclease Z [Prolixibacteraceae bacterium]